jgi:hypothetical protein
VLFYFHKCGNTNIRALENVDITEAYWHINIEGSRPAYELYEDMHGNNKVQFILVRHPIKRFYSGYAHYWRQYRDNFADLRPWINRELEDRIEHYNIDVHVRLFKKVLEDFKRKDCQHASNTIAFYLHCIHDMSQDYQPGMQVMKLDDANYNTHLWSMDPVFKRLKPMHKNKGIDYPEDKLTGKNKDFIYKYYKKSSKLFGYKYDH